MREKDIRQLIIAALRRTHPDSRDTVIVEELGLCFGVARIDIAVVNGRLSGYEIKSARDTLSRLPRQIGFYGRVLDEVTLVCAPRHCDSVRALIPSWWGMAVAETTGSRHQHIETRRVAKQNPAVDPAAVLQLLWRNELLTAARRAGLPKVSRATRSDLVSLLAQALSPFEARHLVREQLKTREALSVRQ